MIRYPLRTRRLRDGRSTMLRCLLGGGKELPDDYQNLTDRLKRRGMELEAYVQTSRSEQPETYTPTGAAVLIVKRSTGATLCHCATLGEVLAFLIGYDACRKDVREGLDDDGP